MLRDIKNYNKLSNMSLIILQNVNNISIFSNIWLIIHMRGKSTNKIFVISLTVSSTLKSKLLINKNKNNW